MPLPVVGNAGEVQIGPGAIYVAPIGTAEPVSASGALDPAFKQIGYTEDGNTFTYEITVAEIDVAELFDPISYATTKRAASIAFQMAQVSATNLNLSLNNGAATTVAGKGIAPPAVGSELRVMIVFDGQNGSRWTYRRCLQSTALKIDHKKAPDKSLLPVQFNLEIPVAASASLPPGSTGFEPFWVFPTSAGLVA